MPNRRPRSQRVVVINPERNTSGWMTLESAKRRERAGHGHFSVPDRVFVMHSAQQPGRDGRLVLPLVIGHFSGVDACPGRAVMPPSPEVIAKFQSRPSRFIPPSQVLRERAEREAVLV